MVKIDLYGNKLSGFHNLKTVLNDVCYDDKSQTDLIADDGIDPAEWTDGKRNFDIPITVDKSDVKVVKVDKKGKVEG